MPTPLAFRVPRSPAVFVGREVELAEALASSSPEIDPSLLARLSGKDATSPVAARRACALLGRDARLDRFDTLVVDSWRNRSRAEPPGAATKTPATEAGWSFDPATSSVALPGGRSVDLGRHALLARILDVLLAQGSAGATKEDLVRGQRRGIGVRPGRRLNPGQLLCRRVPVGAGAGFTPPRPSPR